MNALTHYTRAERKRALNEIAEGDIFERTVIFTLAPVMLCLHEEKDAYGTKRLQRLGYRFSEKIAYYLDKYGKDGMAEAARRDAENLTKTKLNVESRLNK